MTGSGGGDTPLPAFALAHARTRAHANARTGTRSARARAVPPSASVMGGSHAHVAHTSHVCHVSARSCSAHSRGSGGVEPSKPQQFRGFLMGVLTGWGALLYDSIVAIATEATSAVRHTVASTARLEGWHGTVPEKPFTRRRHRRDRLGAGTGRGRLDSRKGDATTCKDTGG